MLEIPVDNEPLIFLIFLCFLDSPIVKNRDDCNHLLTGKEPESLRMARVPEAFNLTLDILNGRGYKGCFPVKRSALLTIKKYLISERTNILNDTNGLRLILSIFLIGSVTAQQQP
jgi:hypothetical protein